MKLLFIGDSLMAGYPYTSKESIPTLISQNSSWEIINGGLTGATTKEIMESLDSRLALHPDYVLVLCGTNDALYASSDARAIYSDILSIMQQIMAAGALPILVTAPICYPHEAPSYNREDVGTGAHCGINLEEMMFRKAGRVLGELHDLIVRDWANKPALFIDLYSLFEERNRFTQGLNATPQSYEIMAEILSDELKKLLK